MTNTLEAPKKPQPPIPSAVSYEKKSTFVGGPAGPAFRPAGPTGCPTGARPASRPSGQRRHAVRSRLCGGLRPQPHGAARHARDHSHRRRAPIRVGTSDKRKRGWIRRADMVGNDHAGGRNGRVPPSRCGRKAPRKVGGWSRSPLRAAMY